MKAQEVAFWLDWYAEWDATLAAFRATVEETSYYRFYPRPGFEEGVLRVHALVHRAACAPIAALTSDTHSASDRRQARPEASDWPDPDIPAAAASALRNLIREPYYYAAGDPSMAELDEVRSLDHLAAAVSAAALLREVLGGQQGPDVEAVQKLLEAASDVLFRAAKCGIAFLDRQRVEDTLRELGLARAVLVPFQRFVDLDLSLNRLLWTYSDQLAEDRDSIAESDSGQADGCPVGECCDTCGERLDPALKYCWDCQCGGKDWE